MATIEEHISPDGRLRFVVVADAGGDLTLGFAGFPWHTHADILASLSGLPEPEAVRRFVAALLGDRSAIAIQVVTGEVRDIWVSEEPARDATYPLNGEAIELRYWSGRPWVVV